MARGNLSRENEMCFNHALPGHRIQAHKMQPQNTIFFLCDVQTKFSEPAVLLFPTEID